MEEMFAPRAQERSSITPEQALIHMIKVMMGTGRVFESIQFRQISLFSRNVVAPAGLQALRPVARLCPTALHLSHLYLLHSAARLRAALCRISVS